MIGQLIAAYMSVSGGDGGKRAELVCVVVPRHPEARPVEVRVSTPVPDCAAVGIQPVKFVAGAAHLVSVSVEESTEKDGTTYGRFVVVISASAAGDSLSPIKGPAWIAKPAQTASRAA